MIFLSLQTQALRTSCAFSDDTRSLYIRTLTDTSTHFLHESQPSVLDMGMGETAVVAHIFHWCDVPRFSRVSIGAQDDVVPEDGM